MEKQIVSIILTFLFLGCTKPHHEKNQFYHMDTVLDVTVVTDKQADSLKPLWATIDSFLSDWDARYSDYGSLSEIQVINHRTTGVVPVSPRLGRMIADAVGYGETTGGSYDITILPLKELWGLGYLNREKVIPSEVIPSDDSIRSTLRRVGFRHVHINSTFDTVVIDQPDVVVDAGGFAKGYALIKVGELLYDRGFRDYLVAAGDIIARGKRFNGASWVIGIAHPRRPGKLLATVPLDSGAIFTSGDYERRWQSNPLVHHIFNPFTGHSCTRNQSLTIWSTDPLEAKFLSTGLFGWRSDSILSFVNQRNLKAVIVDSAGKVIITPNWTNEVALEQ